MDAEKALEILRHSENSRGALFKTDLDTAHLMALEALAWIVQNRKILPFLKDFRLPSEDIK